ncbi:MAG: diacylglycerol kinase [Spirochaetia bacterium]|nr:diacylglycerol kinase [Spirochaetia bacterium]
MVVFQKIVNALGYAIKGVWYGFYSRKNITVFSLVAALIAVLLIWLGTSMVKFAIIMLAWMLVIIVEITNTAVEKVIDTLHPQFSEDIGHAKDMMAGAVFMAILTAVLTTAFMLLTPFIEKITGIQ